MAAMEMGRSGLRATQASMDLEANKAVVREFDELGNGAGDLSRLELLCAPNMVNHALAPGRPQGLGGTRAFLESARRDVHPARWVKTHMAAEGDLVVQFGSRESEWTGGPFRGFDLEPGRCVRDVMFAYRLEGGRISERWAIRDDLAMILELGGRPRGRA
jgi:ketosteroid isomerase-like protein